MPFDKYFQVEPLQEYTKVILMKDFMQHLAPKVWPVGSRAIFCYAPRSTKSSCAAKEGNPFGPYWNAFNIEFDKDIFYGPLGYDANDQNGWISKYPASEYPVLAFTGAPGSFPVAQQNVHLQKYVKWSKEFDAKATQFLKKINPNNEKIIGVHLRNGVDFVRFYSEFYMKLEL